MPPGKARKEASKSKKPGVPEAGLLTLEGGPVETYEVKIAAMMKDFIPKQGEREKTLKLPSLHTVNRRPVKLVPTEDGGMSVQALNLETREFERDLSYLSRVVLSDTDADEVDQDTFDRRVAQIRSEIAQ